MPQDIFIAHAASDARQGLRLARAIEARNWRCWLVSRDFKGGIDGPELIDAAIRSSRMMVALGSAEAFASEEVEREISYAKSLAIPLAVVTIDQGRPPRRMHQLLAKAPHYDARDAAFDSQIDAIVAFTAGVLAGVAQPSTTAARPMGFHSFSDRRHTEDLGRPGPRKNDPRQTPLPSALAEALREPRVTAPHKKWAWMAMGLAVVAVIGAVALREIAPRLARNEPKQEPAKVSAQLRPAVTQAVDGLLVCLEAADSKLRDAQKALDRKHFALPDDGGDAKVRADLAKADFDDIGGRRARKTEIEDIVRMLDRDINAPEFALEPLLQRGAETSVLMKFRARLKDVGNPDLVVRALHRSIADLDTADAESPDRLLAVRERTTRAVELLDCYGRLAFVLAARLIAPARALWPEGAEARLRNLRTPDPRTFESEDHALVAQSSLETNAARLEEWILANLEEESPPAASTDETPVSSTVENPADEKTGDESFRETIQKAIEARAKGEEELAVALFRRYEERFGGDDPTAKDYVRHAVLLTQSSKTLGVRGGLFVAGLPKDSKLATAGLLARDIICLYDDVEIRSFDGLRRLLEGATGDHEITIEILRLDENGEWKRLTLKVVDAFTGVDLLPI